MSKLALHKHGGDIMKAAEDLLANNGIVDGDLSILNASEDSANDKEEHNEKKEEAFKRIAGDISMVEDDHLDLTLSQEEVFLNQYLSLLENEQR
jgi:hypothetical protein